MVGRDVFTDLFHLLESLEHDFREEKGERVHSFGCRRYKLGLRLESVRGADSQSSRGY
jgi:hypothetical protein